MKRILKFPLIMNNEKEVRTIAELRENFNLKKVIEYYFEGKLKTWLQHRNYTQELSQLEKLECCDDRNKIPVMLCEIFDVEQSIDLNISEIERRKSRISILKSFSDNEEWEKKLEFIAFTQEELERKLMSGDLYSIYDNKTKLQIREIYLCGDTFTVSEKFKNIAYVGVNTPLVNIISTNVFDAKANNIKFDNVKITSEEFVEVAIKDIKDCIIDDNKISIRNIWESIPIIIDGEFFDKVLIYKNKIIRYCSYSFEITDINNGHVLKNLSDLELIFLKTREVGSYLSKLEIEICAVTIYKSTVLCVCGNKSGPKDIRVIYVNLETLEIDKVFNLTTDGNYREYISDLQDITVHEDKIIMYDGYERNYFDLRSASIVVDIGSRCQYHDFNTGKYIGISKCLPKYEKNEYFSESGIGNRKFYEGNIYEFLPQHKQIKTNNESYVFKGFKKFKNEDKGYTENISGKIGAFEIYSGKIIAAGCYIANSSGVKIANGSVLNEDGYIAVYNINGGDVIEARKVSNSIIRLIKYYKGMLVIISEDGNVKILDAETLDTLNTIKLPVNKNSDENYGILFGFSTVVDIHIDNNLDKMAILYGKKTYIYE